MENDLNRFVKAQENDYKQALTEIKSGRKRSHWMWYVFPQFKGLGYSDISKFYAIQNLHEAIEYLNHPILGSRLIEITNELNLLHENDANKIFGSPDDLKLKSSMTLFSFIDRSKEMPFKKVIEKYFNGKFDNKTLNLLK
ncbi:DUF1810 domain-containing protein [Pseudotamlana agarivorans]|uniref:DUF1810 domain-containing protein n=1 Tax=Pseudotamlana agarivorans TaxID=481183 RepID=UPI00082AB334|nr:DUF1810 domain-containing protein [Tamlana agarivorans]